MENFIARVQKGQWLKAAITVAACSVMSGGAYAQSLVEDEAVRRSENALLASELVKKADEAYNGGDYFGAYEAYENALGLLSTAPAVLEYRKAVAERYGSAATELSREYMRVGKRNEARSILSGVLEPEVAPGHVGALNMLARLDDPIRYNPVASLKHTQDIDAVAKNLRRAEGYLDLGLYDKALVEYEEVLQIDGYNVAARRGMERIHRLQSRYFDFAYDEARANALKQVDQTWEIEVPPVVDLSGGASGNAFQGGVVVSREEEILAKMRNIIIPIVDLEQITLEEVSGLLVAWSREHDQAELDPEKKGINVIMDLGDPNTEEGQLVRARSFNLKLRNVPLEGVVQHISDQVGLSWRAGEYALEIRPVGAFSEEYITRSFKVPPQFLVDVASDGGADGGDPFQIPDLGSGTRLRRQSPQEYLEKHGIDFPDGASVSYVPSSNIVTMINTADNLDLLEQVVDSLISGGDLSVVVKMTIIDVEQSDLEEIGFDWLVSPAPGNGTRITGGTVGNGSVIPAIGGVAAAGPVTSGLRSGDGLGLGDAIDAAATASFADSGTATTPQRAPGILGVTGEVSNATVAAVLTGLSQKGATDKIWQPSLITRSGEKSIVTTGLEFPYPEEYEPPELPNTVSTGGLSPVTPATPTSFTTRNLGFRLEVEPTVGPNKQYINLRVNPELRDFDGFINYGSPINGDTGTGTLATITDNTILQPIFSILRSNTSVSISDGSTIAIGGLMQQNTVIVEDKVPILGSLPVVGRLFQRSGIVPTTRAVVIFVTAELVDPTGARINP